MYLTPSLRVLLGRHLWLLDSNSSIHSQGGRRLAQFPLQVVSGAFEIQSSAHFLTFTFHNPSMAPFIGQEERTRKRPQETVAACQGAGRPVGQSLGLRDHTAIELR